MEAIQTILPIEFEPETDICAFRECNNASEGTAIVAIGESEGEVRLCSSCHISMSERGAQGSYYIVGRRLSFEELWWQ